MFGFLIAMIKNTFDRNNQKKEHNKYIQRCEMNQVSYNIYKLIPFVPVFDTDLVVISAYFEGQIEIIRNPDKLFRKQVKTGLNEVRDMVNDLIKRGEAQDVDTKEIMEILEDAKNDDDDSKAEDKGKNDDKAINDEKAKHWDNNLWIFRIILDRFKKTLIIF